jgi:hypothetical protein
MTLTESPPLADLYLQDETAWLDIMSKLVAERRFAEMDLPHLSEYLNDMAIRDRREVCSRLMTLLVHLLKYEYQPEKRPGSWDATIMEQRDELRMVLESRTLFNHAEKRLADAYENARKRAAAETGLPRSTFPAECPWDLETILRDEDEQE